MSPVLLSGRGNQRSPSWFLAGGEGLDQEFVVESDPIADLHGHPANVCVGELEQRCGRTCRTIRPCFGRGVGVG
jgi:hypothetical protein